MSDKDYEVGHGRPPKHTQFKKGQSGNPKGRKKGVRGLKTDLRAEFNERIEITENGKTVKLTKQQAMLKHLIAKAIKGDVRATSKLLELAIALLGPDDEERKSTDALPTDDQAIINEFLSRQSKHAPDE